MMFVKTAWLVSINRGVRDLPWLSHYGAVSILRISIAKSKDIIKVVFCFFVCFVLIFLVFCFDNVSKFSLKIFHNCLHPCRIEVSVRQ